METSSEVYPGSSKKPAHAFTASSVAWRLATVSADGPPAASIAAASRASTRASSPTTTRTQGNDQPAFLGSMSICTSVCRVGSISSGFSLAVSTGPSRVPMAITVSAWLTNVFAAGWPKLPHTPSASALVSANTPLPEAVVATGAPIRVASASSSVNARLTRTPLPAIITGCSAARISSAAAFVPGAEFAIDGGNTVVHSPQSSHVLRCVSTSLPRQRRLERGWYLLDPERQIGDIRPIELERGAVGAENRLGDQSRRKAITHGGD